ncbi:cadherin EGF LAG seven-pass G-type receptor 2-like [Mytilus galloprovincialis]|uniref:cadherin EGF LAG seven-pass G-type receptor 2-like n=1 Tax=Mytilus galloprovincialis TaxID=29158 RepID=UPI003F7C97CE
MGLHSTGNSIIFYENTGGTRLKLTGVTSAMTSPYDWSAATDNNNFQYAINARTTPSEIPTFSALPDITKFNDEVLVGDIVTTVTATDNDPEDANVLQITFDGGSTYFEYLNSTNEIRVISVPPVGVHNPSLTVTDPCDKSSSSTQKITIVNRLPVINNLPSTVSILEDTPDDTLIFTINATDTVTFPVTCDKKGGAGIPFNVSDIPPTDNGVFMDPGVTLNYDNNPSYTITVRCNDDDDNVEGILTINIIPNQAPVINSLPDSVSFLEDDNTNTLLHRINVTDFEGDLVTCSLNPTSTIFDVSLIPPSTVEYGIFLTGGTTLDYDIKDSYSLSAKCEDQRRSDTELFTVNLIRNTPPVINSLPYTESISEDLMTYTLIHTLNVTDVNIADIITCTLNSQNTLFELTKISPALEDYGVFLKGGTVLNYDITPSYSLDIECGDHRRKVADVLTVDLIRNEPPTIINLPMSCEIPENIETESLLYTVSVTDPTNDSVTCTLVAASSIYFLQSGSTQFETEIYVRGNQDFVYDTQKQYTIDLVCKDLRRSDSSYFYVYLLRNMPPSFTNLQAKTTVSAQAVVAGQDIYTITSVDPESDNVQYTMTSSSATPPFTINQNTGAISLSRSIETELEIGYELFISLSDGRNTVASRTLSVRIIDINHPPKFLNPIQTEVVLEGISIGSSIFQPSITDEDLSDVHTFLVSYSPPEGAVYFGVDMSSGLITSLVDIDYETIPYKTFLLTITGSDSLMVDTTNITLNIQNVNEPPKFTKKNYAFSATENSGGTVLQNPYYQFTEEDGDSVKFSIDCGTETGLLDIDSSTGFLSYSIDYDLDVVGTASQLICQVHITDNEYTDTAFLNITILDENDNAPVFQQNEYTFFVTSISSVGTDIGNVEATDKDIGVYGNIIYHLAQEDINSGLFSVSVDGFISSKQSLENIIPGTIFNLTVYAVDSGGNEHTTLVYIVIPDTEIATNNYRDIIYYKTFFSFSPNMAWFVPLMMVLMITACVVLHTIYKGYCTCSKTEKKQKKKYSKYRKRKTAIEM